MKIDHFSDQLPFGYHHANHDTSLARGNCAFPLSANSLPSEMEQFLKQVGVGDNCAPVKAAKHVVIKYDPEYIKFGFIRAGCDAELKAKCVECVEILSAQLFFFSSFLFNMGTTFKSTLRA